MNQEPRTNNQQLPSLEQLQQDKLLRMDLAQMPTQAQFKHLLSLGLNRHQAGILLHHLGLR
ncbi:hypothetical protein [Prosthecobacter sp.]|uniref:hypothetical protein n=1 Tax=Prosthecobacter sp. TaxID=1965333 RepID=UPI003BB1D529